MESSRFGQRVGVVTLFATVYVGYFKETFALSWIPFDPTLPLVMLLLVLLMQRCVLLVSLGYQLPFLWPVVLWASFVPGAVYAVFSDYDLYKTAYLFSITLLVSLAGTVMVDSSVSVRAWMVAQVAAAFVMAIGLLIAPDRSYMSLFGRYSVEGASSIGVGRVLGAGALVLIVVSFAMRGWLRAYSMFGGICLSALMVLVGSRGPILSLLLSILLVVCLAKGLRRVRTRLVIATSLGICVAAFIFFQGGSAGGRRFGDFVEGQSVDTIRESLLTKTLELMGDNPLGVGWGGFAHILGDESFGATYTHNMVLEIFLEGGWLAGAVFVVFVWFSMLALQRGSATREGMVLFALASYWFCVAQTSSDINGNRMTLVALGLAVGVHSAGARHQSGSRSLHDAEVMGRGC